MKQKLLRCLRALLSVLVVLFLVVSPRFLVQAVRIDRYRAFFEREKADWHGVITIWHIVGFSPYQGSGSRYLEARAEAFAKSRPGVTVKVIGMSPAHYQELTARGQKPDAYSFPAGFLYQEQLRSLDLDLPSLTGGVRAAEADGKLYAAPYCMSAYALLMNTQLLFAAGLDVPEAPDALFLQQALDRGGKTPQLAMPPVLAAEAGLTGTLADYADFKAGKVMLAVADLRAYGNLTRNQDGNLLFEAAAYPGYTELVQYLGAAKDTDDKRAALIAEFIGTLLSDPEQQRLPEVGYLPVAAGVPDVVYADPVLKECYEAQKKLRSPDPFQLERHGGALLADAEAALTGDAAAKAAFQKRLLVVLGTDF